MSALGRPMRRREDPALLTGAARFVEDLRAPGALEAVFVRSAHAHGVLRRVDLEPCRSAPGVVAAFAAADLPDLPPAPASPGMDVPEAMERPSLAADRVRFVGEAVAAVLAEDRARAEDAAELARVEVDPLPPVLDPTASADAAARLFPGASNVVWHRTYGEDVTDALASAPVRLALSVDHGRVAPASMEPRRILVEPGEDASLTVWLSHQTPHRLRGLLAAALGLPADAVRVVVPAVGGAFGAKGAVFPEFVVAAYLARRLGRPVRWVEGRSESLFAATHGRAQVHRLDAGADPDGRLLALRVEVDADIGAYPHAGSLVPSATALVLSGPYRIPRLSVSVRTVVTNTAPISPYRGAGRPEAALSLERLMDELAAAVGADPAEVRRRNFIPPDAFPYRSPTGAVYDSGDYEAALDLALEKAGYAALREEQRRRREEGASGPLLGIGIGSYVERSGGQSGSTEYGRVDVLADGSIVARSGSSSHGQGHGTAFAQIVGSALDVDPERVEVVQGDTAEVAQGTGTFASRSMQVGGSALTRASEAVLARARERAATRLGARPGELMYAAGTFCVAAEPERAVALGDLAREDDLWAEHVFESPQAFPFGTYVAVVEIDRETGKVDLRRIVAVDDVGIVVNPLLMEGQTVGSIMQGIGQALYEDASYDAEGRLLATSFVSYAIPGAPEATELVLARTVTPAPEIPLGAKGAGESGCIGAPPAIVNAVIDALRGLDAGPLDVPLSPEKVWGALQQARR